VRKGMRIASHFSKPETFLAAHRESEARQAAAGSEAPGVAA